MEASSVTSPGQTLKDVPAKIARSKFYVIMASLLILVVLIGFARTFFLRPAFQTTDLPIHLIFHGSFLTAWFVLALVQPVLIFKGNRRLHRKLGVAGVVIAVGIVVFAIMTLVRRDAPTLDAQPARSLGNLITVFAFALCVGVGVALRNRAVLHKRLMLIASMCLIAPAIDRLSLVPPFEGIFASMFANSSSSPNILAATFGTVGLFLSVVVYDLITTRRVKVGTMLGLGFMWVLAPALSAAVSLTGLWADFVRAVT